MDNIKAILLMGGAGNRFNHEIPKQFHYLSGKKVYLHTLETFLDSKQFTSILLVCHPTWIPQVKKEIPPSVSIIPGGKTRQESSYLGLKACGEDTDFVVIHDAVRPLLSMEILLNNIKSVISAKAIDTCIPSKDTIIHTTDCKNISSIPDRKQFYRGQTPQSFSYSLILHAHQAAQKKGITDATDDCQLIQEHPVEIVLGSENNLKITTELDLFIVEQLMRIKTHQIPSKSDTLEKKSYIVTGGTGGIGKAICQALIFEGARAIALSPSSSEYPIDLTSPEKAKSIFQSIGPIDGIINSMGFLCIKPFKKLSTNELNDLISINYLATIYSCKYAQIKPGGHIINISSSSFTKGRKDYAIYSSMKSAIVNFTQALAEEHPELNINTVVPKRTRTPLRTKNFPNEDPSTLLPPEKTANAIIDLLKNQSLTGCIIEVKP